MKLFTSQSKNFAEFEHYATEIYKHTFNDQGVPLIKTKKLKKVCSRKKQKHELKNERLNCNTRLCVPIRM